jgi:hypothetical protein
MSPFIVAGLIMALAAIFGGIAYWSYQARKKRREALAEVALEMRWTFLSDGDDSLLSSLGGFHLFSMGHSKRFSNVLRGSTEHGGAAIFDYQYTTGGGKNRHTHHYTVLSLSPGGRPLPRFALRPEHVWHKIGAALGYKDIDFENFPEFSKRYLLRGDDEMGIRDLFGARLISFFEKNPGLCLEGEAGSLILYRDGKRLKPEEIRPFVQKGVELSSLLR